MELLPLVRSAVARPLPGSPGVRSSTAAGTVARMNRDVRSLVAAGQKLTAHAAVLAHLSRERRNDELVERARLLKERLREKEHRARR